MSPCELFRFHVVARIILLATLVVVAVGEYFQYLERVKAGRVKSQLQITMQASLSYESIYGTLPPQSSYNSCIKEHISWRYRVAHIIEHTDIPHFIPGEYDCDKDTVDYNRWRQTRIPAMCRRGSNEASIYRVVGDGDGLENIKRDENRVVLVESNEMSLHWMNGKDIELPAQSIQENDANPEIALFRKRMESSIRGCYAVAMASGEVVFLDKNIPLELLISTIIPSQDNSRNSRASIYDYQVHPGQSLLVRIFRMIKQ